MTQPRTEVETKPQRSKRQLPTKIGAFEAKTKLGQLLDQVEAGDTIVITRHGRAVASMVPFKEEVDAQHVSKVVDALLNFKSGARLPAGLSIKDLVSEGRR